MGNRQAPPGAGTVTELIGRRWAMMIVQQLAEGPHRFNELKGSMPGISSKTLSLNLKELEKARIANRRVIGTKPLHVEYALTEKGTALVEVLETIESWGHRWMSVKG